MTSFFNINHILHPSQYEFRIDISTSNALADNIESVISSLLDSHNNGAIMSIDLKKSFDTLDHNILKQNLSFYGKDVLQKLNIQHAMNELIFWLNINKFTWQTYTKHKTNILLFNMRNKNKIITLNIKIIITF